MIEELTLRGFKSYKSSQTVRFTRGVNKISGRNASGKTTLLQAVLFGLFGDVPGTGKQDLVPLGGGTVDVTVTLRSPFTGTRLTIHREGGLARDGGFRTTKSVLKVDGEETPYVREREIQTKLRELLGIGRSTFLNVVYAQQKEFIEILKPDRRRMDAILGLTTPAEIREQFRVVRRMLEDRGRISEKGTLEERIRNAEEGRQDCDRQLEEVRSRREKLSQGLQEMEAELYAVDNRVETLESILVEYQRLVESTTRLELLQEQRDKSELELSELLETIGQDPESRRQELQRRRQSAEVTEEILRRQLDESLGPEKIEVGSIITRLEHQVNEHVGLREQGLAICPKCGQEIDYELIEEDVARWEKQLDEERARLGDLDREIRAVQQQVDAARKRFTEEDRAVTRFVDQERNINRLRKEIGDIERQGSRLVDRIRQNTESLITKVESELATPFASIEDAQETMDGELQRARAQQRELSAEVRSRRDRIRDTETRETEIQSRKEDLRRVMEESRGLLDRILEYEAKIRAVDSIQRRYGEYEQQLRENTLKLLEYQTYNYFRRLTDQQAYAGCHIDRERYTLEVQPIGANRLIPAWLAGGGHESLFALAERLALLRVMGFPHLLILDEPTDAVDSENVPQLLEYIARGSREIGQILLVTHHGHGEEEGVNLIRVRKVGGESRIYQELGAEL